MLHRVSHHSECCIIGCSTNKAPFEQYSTLNPFVRRPSFVVPLKKERNYQFLLALPVLELSSCYNLGSIPYGCRHKKHDLIDAQTGQKELPLTPVSASHACYQTLLACTSTAYTHSDQSEHHVLLVPIRTPEYSSRLGDKM